MMQVDCPCCGAEMTGESPDFLLHLKNLTATQALIVDKLVSDYPRPIKTEEFLDLIYAESDGDNTRVLRVHMCHVRQKLKVHGWLVITTGSTRCFGNRANYKLEKEAG